MAKPCAVLGQPDLAEDPRFATNPLRAENYEALRPLLAGSLAERKTSAWQEQLDEAGVPNGPINDVAQVMADPQVRARQMIVEVEHPVAGVTHLPGIPIKLSETPGSIRSPAPLLGQHTDAILVELLGYDAEHVVWLREEEPLMAGESVWMGDVLKVFRPLAAAALPPVAQGSGYALPRRRTFLAAGPFSP